MTPPLVSRYQHPAKGRLIWCQSQDKPGAGSSVNPSPAPADQIQALLSCVTRFRGRLRARNAPLLEVGAKRGVVALASVDHDAVWRHLELLGRKACLFKRATDEPVVGVHGFRVTSLPTLCPYTRQVNALSGCTERSLAVRDTFSPRLRRRLQRQAPAGDELVSVEALQLEKRRRAGLRPELQRGLAVGHVERVPRPAV